VAPSGAAPAVDAEETGIIYINSNEMAWDGAPSPRITGGENSPRAIYMSQCSICHGETMDGLGPPRPCLPWIGVGERLTPRADGHDHQERKRTMPGLSESDRGSKLRGDQFFVGELVKAKSSQAPHRLQRPMPLPLRPVTTNFSTPEG